MSRYPFDEGEPELEEMNQDTTKAVCNPMVSDPYIDSSSMWYRSSRGN